MAQAASDCIGRIGSIDVESGVCRDRFGSRNEDEGVLSKARSNDGETQYQERTRLLSRPRILEAKPVTGRRSSEARRGVSLFF
jgi:hypothetical protein